MKYKIGDKVKTKFGVGEVLFIDIENNEYLVGVKGVDGYTGYSGEVWLKKEERQKNVINKGYENQCSWFYEDELESIEEENKIKYKIGDRVQTEYGIGEILFTDNVSNIPYLVGIKARYCFSDTAFLAEERLTKEERKKYVTDKGYERQCIWFVEKALKLIKEEKKMNEYTKLLMENLRLEVEGEFDIINYPYNPCHFDEEGNLLNDDGNAINDYIYYLMQGKASIKCPKLTEREIKKIELYQKRGYRTIAEILEVNKKGGK